MKPLDPERATWAEIAGRLFELDALQRVRRRLELEASNDCWRTSAQPCGFPSPPDDDDDRKR